MEKFIIKGPTSKGVKGSLECSGAKNSALPLMASSILFDGTVILKNVPFVNDVKTMSTLLISLGSKVELFEKKKIIKITNNKKHKLVVPFKLISTMRAGVLAMGSLLGRYNRCSTAMSGGCSLGNRGIGFHLEGFKKLNCQYKLRKGYINIVAKNGIKGNIYKFPKVSVTGTSNLIMASVLGNGIVILKNVSIEPEVLDVIRFLKNGGAKINFIGKRKIKICGVKRLNGCSHEVIGDRIEAFSYLCTAAITRGKIKINKIDPKNLKKELNILKKMGCDLKIKESSIEIDVKKKLKPIKIKTAPFPGFATDNMPPLMAVLTKVKGKSEIQENIFSQRFQCVPELNKMGASITIKNNKAIIMGKDKLYGAECISSDLRTTFSIILGAIAASETSIVNRVYHGFRGYYKLDKKLKNIGINIKKIS
ncbi:UDP-N-acetylglucosamine 1-carboxyvinyltransferase [Candidatus Pelagibacter sp.]|nr:UDP-N-acetylglucosamine 1-carboxyvinyltransferase [Candidatus Pelagibacter sp.]